MTIKDENLNSDDIFTKIAEFMPRIPVDRSIYQQEKLFISVFKIDSFIYDYDDDEYQYNSNQSPNEIYNFYDIDTSDFGVIYILQSLIMNLSYLCVLVIVKNHLIIAVYTIIIN